MKTQSEIARSIEADGRLEIRMAGLDGGMAVFTRGPMKGMSVIWSFGGGWEHVSIDGKKRTPDWDEMCLLKDLFFKEDEVAVQYHPAKSDYVNNVSHCLHLWRPIEMYAGKLPTPPSIMVGIKELGTLD